MSVTVTKFPKATVNSNSNTVSRWNAHQPIIFEMVVSGLNVNYTQITGGGTTLTIFLNDAYTGTVGESIILTNGTIQDGTYSVVTITSTTEIIVAFVSASEYVTSGGTVDYVAPDFFVKIRVLGVTPAGVYFLIGTSENKPASDGTFKVDVSSFLKKELEYQNDFDYALINERDIGLGGMFNMSFAECTGSTEGTFSTPDNTNIYYYVNANKQIQDLYGSNMGEFVPFDNFDSADPRAKFLSDFDEPTYPPDYPFSLAFVYSESISGNTNTREEEQFDLSGGSIATSSTSLIPDYQQHVDRLIIAGSYASTVKLLDVWLNSDPDTPDCIQYVDEDYVADTASPPDLYVEEICGPFYIEDLPTS